MPDRFYNGLSWVYAGIATLALDAAAVASAHYVCKRIGLEPETIIKTDLFVGLGALMPSVLAGMWSAERLETIVRNYRRKE